ncbi:class I SAM-dependent methyltransferase [Megalodesulfovibrio gigas]|uniref:Putative O-Methyltransferase n=1 Tax=Megalodesulfovibrio gigas (strain ATCC 19364 / DSM 1382 / NCIMB 9332 / VKM B-1759) TaxID=1121448 RepID=T2GB27_MEGG1|nr:methyltransferase [Megalodesulfovibrio gigas]AGW13498.1 putative O-Methyltransferase [Megalodesulfovibrio gigas DSM 1382 = ATCC 19364]
MTMHQTTDLDALLAQLAEAYPVAFEAVTLDGLTLDVLQIADLSAYLDRMLQQAGTQPAQLPLFAKLWSGALMLGYVVKRMPLPPQARVLELGAGVGLCGMVAAARGLQTVLADAHPHALGFLQAGVLKNGLSATAQVLPLDASFDAMADRYELILAVEPDLDPESMRALAKRLVRRLAPTATAQCLLAFNYGRNVKKLMGILEKDFHIQQQVVGAKAGEALEDKRLVAIYRCTPRKIVS